MQADTTSLEVPGQSVYDEKCSKCAKSKLSYKSSQRAVKQPAGLSKDAINSVRTVDKNSLVSYYCLSFFAGLSDHCKCRVFHVQSSYRLTLTAAFSNHFTSRGNNET